MRKVKISIKYDTIPFNGTVYELSNPLMVDIISKQGRPLSIAVKELGIFAYGKTIDEVKNNFCEEFDFIYNRYTQLDDNLLSNNVIEIKKRLNKLVLTPSPA